MTQAAADFRLQAGIKKTLGFYLSLLSFLPLGLPGNGGIWAGTNWHPWVGTKFHLAAGPHRPLLALKHRALAALGICSLAALQIIAVTGRKLQHPAKLYTGGCFGVAPGLQMWKGRQRILHSCESGRAEFEVCWPWVEYWLCDLGKTPAWGLTSLLHSH